MTRRLVVEADGGSRGNPGPAGYGAVVRDAASGEVLREVAASIGVTTNNVAEYRGLIAGLQAAAEERPDLVEVRMDSKLVVEQMAGRWRIRHPAIRELAGRAAAQVRRLPQVSFVHVPREANAHADRLANEAMDAAARGVAWAPRRGPADPPGWSPPAGPDNARSRPTPGGPVGWVSPAGPPTRLLLLRHGETAWSAEHRFAGVTDLPLQPAGREQARQTGSWLAAQRPIGGLVSSPLARAAQTAAELAGVLDLPVTLDEGWRETDFGEWEGRTLAEVRERWPAEYRSWLADPQQSPPGGESLQDTVARATAARDRALAQFPATQVVVVSHVTPIKAVLLDGLGAPAAALFRLYLDVAALTGVDCYPDGSSVLRYFNATGHLGQHRG